ncbi:putative membrane protein [Campylobacter hyointestinalis subsp. lawsonii CCUG 27631]|uniref:hypothetical protein n=1 Tax=Campylobacter hyointestinalis TaxID=198 RepID=UPI0007C927B9|nr:hypothetical protein [Campylobacter hyointestinalis]ANE34690.1 putative membrane protein [Campylobacter hyointestinalis subsp. lawsonii CCUG 27631]
MKNLKTKVITGVFGLMSLSSLASVAVTIDDATGKVSGSLDVGPYMAAFGLVIIAVAAMWAAKKALSLFGR